MNSSDIQLQVRARTGVANGLVQRYHRFNKKEIELLQEAALHGEEALRFNSKLDAVHKCVGFAYHQLSQAMFDIKQGETPEIRRIRALGIEFYKKAVKYNKKHYIAYNNLGNLYLEWSKKVEGDLRHRLLNNALKECLNALSINPRYFHAHDNAGHVYLQLKKFDEANTSFMNAVLYNASYPEAKNDLGILYLQKEYRLNDPEKAQKYHEEALHLAESENQKKKLIAEFQLAKNIAGY